jgi:hypothetical protein
MKPIDHIRDITRHNPRATTRLHSLAEWFPWPWEDSRVSRVRTCHQMYRSHNSDPPMLTLLIARCTSTGSQTHRPQTASTQMRAPLPAVVQGHRLTATPKWFPLCFRSSSTCSQSRHPQTPATQPHSCTSPGNREESRDECT